jgi:ADP-dependent NAD(P)H-hydrate dehydratase / NAD(P)H-hydrate epimerase
MKLVTVEQMRAIEAASDAQGHTYAAMMDHAGSVVARVASTRVASTRVVRTRLDRRDKKILILVGPGNNGGDGLVAARYLHDAGAHIGVYLLKPREDEHTLALEARAIEFITADQLSMWLNDCDMIIDALLGTGTARSIGGDLAELLIAVKQAVSARRSAAPDLIDPAWPSLLQGVEASAGFTSGTTRTPAKASTPELVRPLIIAVDGPTGLNYDTGAIDPLTLPADVSVTFAYPKLGHMRFPGADVCGELIVADIGIDPQLAQDIDRELADPALIRSLLPARPRSAHKGTFGKVLIVSGSTLYTGAPVLAAEAAYRSGAGLVTLATPQSIHAIMASKINEATFLPLPDRKGVISEDAASIILSKLPDYTVTLIGPGLTTDAHGFMEQLLDRVSGPLVLDADALNILAQIDHWWTRVPSTAILTPHPGEMARLTELSMKEIEADRERVAIEWATHWGHVVVLKGAFTVIAAPDGRSISLPFANPALATAGSGDVLAGTIAALRAQGLAAYEAAVCGAYLHGVAGEIARREIGSAGVLAGDLLTRLPRALAALA